MRVCVCHRVKGEGQLWHFTLWTRYWLQFLPNHFQTSHVSCGWWEEEPYWFGSQGQRWRSTLALCVSDIVHTIQTTVFAQSFSNFSCKLWMMRGGTLLILVTGSKVKVNFGTMYKTLWTRYRLQFLPNHFQTSPVSCQWWEEEPYWLWVIGFKVKVNFGTLFIWPCGHDTDYSLCPITFKLYM